VRIAGPHAPAAWALALLAPDRGIPILLGWGAVIVYSDVGGGEPLITFKVELEQEDDGRWLAEVVELPGVLAYGDTQQAALSTVQALALRVIAERLENGEAGPELLNISFSAA
jgi:predicted RNase H-like HicB family nuclease